MNQPRPEPTGGSSARCSSPPRPQECRGRARDVMQASQRHRTSSVRPPQHHPANSQTEQRWGGETFSADGLSTERESLTGKDSRPPRPHRIEHSGDRQNREVIFDTVLSGQERGLSTQLQSVLVDVAQGQAHTPAPCYCRLLPGNPREHEPASECGGNSVNRVRRETEQP